MEDLDFIFTGPIACQSAPTAILTAMLRPKLIKTAGAEPI